MTVRHMISYSDINSLNFQGFQGQNAEMHLKKRVTSKPLTATA